MLTKTDFEERIRIELRSYDGPWDMSSGYLMVGSVEKASSRASLLSVPCVPLQPVEPRKAVTATMRIQGVRGRCSGRPSLSLLRPRSQQVQAVLDPFSGTGPRAGHARRRFSKRVRLFFVDCYLAHS